MMAPTEITRDDFDAFLTDNEIGLLDFWAEWCGPCRYFAPVFDAAAERHPDIAFGKVDTDQETELSQAFGIMSIPTLVAFRDGIILYAQPGALGEEALEDLIRQIRGLDMDEVRRKLEKAG